MLHANSIVEALEKVWKLRREQERPVSTAVSTTGLTTTETEASDLGEISAVQ